MLKTLVKKQLMEIFRSYFYDAKKNRPRSKGKTLLLLSLYALLLVAVLGGFFGFLSYELCSVLIAFDLGWMYFAIMGLIATFLGAFGSVFNTYSSLYLSKDNDLLLSMPIPARTVIASRLLGVYLMGLMYSAVVSLPAAIMYWVVGGFSLAALLGGILYVLLLSMIVLILSCLLGWVVAKISLKLKNRSFVAVAASLVFFFLYYFVCFKAQDILSALVENAVLYGASIKGSAYPLYLFGCIGTGDFLAMAICTAVVALLTLLTWQLLRRSFFKIATSSGTVSKKTYRETDVRQKSVFSALLGKEFARFTSSASYMLNCGLSTLMLVIAGIALLIKGKSLFALLGQIFPASSGFASVLFCAAVCLLSSMNDMAEPSVSLEGKNLFLVQSMPVAPWQALRAKLWMQLLLTMIPAAFCLLCGAFFVGDGVVTVLLAAMTALAFCVFSALAGLFLGVRMADLSWTNETTLLKQSGGVFLILLINWLYAFALAGLYLLFGSRIGAAAYLGIFLAGTVLVSAALYLWLRKSGARRFAEL